MPPAATASAATHAYWSQILADNAAAAQPTAAPAAPAAPAGLWQVYESALKGAKYVDLTHTINPSIPVWAGFRPRQVHADD